MLRNLLKSQKIGRKTEMDKKTGIYVEYWI